MDNQLPDSLEAARQKAGLSKGDLWLRYFALGGMAPAFEVEAILHGAMTTNTHNHNQIVHALNERFTELGQNHPIPYAADQE